MKVSIVEKGVGDIDSEPGDYFGSFELPTAPHVGEIIHIAGKAEFSQVVARHRSWYLNYDEDDPVECRLIVELLQSQEKE